jgi:hypothetical protein
MRKALGIHPDPAPPLPDDAAPESRAWRKAMKAGRFRRADRRGAFAGVRVLDLATTAAPRPGPRPPEPRSGIDPDDPMGLPGPAGRRSRGLAQHQSRP